MMGSIATILILALLAVIVFYCIRSLAKGGSSCGGNCSSCGGSCNHCGSGKGHGAIDAEEVRRQVEILKSEAVAVAAGRERDLDEREYAKQIEAALDADNIPLERRKVAREYFEKLRAAQRAQSAE